MVALCVRSPLSCRLFVSRSRLFCFVSCVKVAIIVVTLLFVHVFVVLGVVVCPRVCLACPFVRSALGRRASLRGRITTIAMSRYVDADVDDLR